jgi:hypothetical protein
MQCTGLSAPTDPKLVFSDGSWVCYRLSGTELVVRGMRRSRQRTGSCETERGGLVLHFRIKTCRIRFSRKSFKVRSGEEAVPNKRSL